MALASGLAGFFGFEPEATPGTFEAPTNFLPLVSESVMLQQERLESDGILAGRRVIDSDQWNGGPQTVGGQVQVELSTLGLVPLFTAALGAVSSAGSDPYTHTLTPGDLSDDALSLQFGRPAITGTVHPFSYAGCKILSWEMACQSGAIATFGFDVQGESQATDETLATPSYIADAKPLKFNHAVVSVGGSTIESKGITLAGDNALDTDRRFLGTYGAATPLEAGLRAYTGNLDVEFAGLTQTNRFLNGDEFAIVFTFTDAASYTITFTLNARFDGADANITGREILQQGLPYKVIGDGSDSDGITVEVVNNVAHGA